MAGKKAGDLDHVLLNEINTNRDMQQIIKLFMY